MVKKSSVSSFCHLMPEYLLGCGVCLPEEEQNFAYVWKLPVPFANVVLFPASWLSVIYISAASIEKQSCADRCAMDARDPGLTHTHRQTVSYSKQVASYFCSTAKANFLNLMDQDLFCFSPSVMYYYTGLPEGGLTR